MAAGGILVNEMSLQGLLDVADDDDVYHLACACNPKLNFCGIYTPWVEGVDLIENDDKVCQACLGMWETIGCGKCPCGPAAICYACIQSSAH